MSSTRRFIFFVSRICRAKIFSSMGLQSAQCIHAHIYSIKIKQKAQCQAWAKVKLDYKFDTGFYKKNYFLFAICHLSLQNSKFSISKDYDYDYDYDYGLRKHFFGKINYPAFDQDLKDASTTFLMRLPCRMTCSVLRTMGMSSKKPCSLSWHRLMSSFFRFFVLRWMEASFLYIKGGQKRTSQSHKTRYMVPSESFLVENRDTLIL